MLIQIEPSLSVSSVAELGSHAICRITCCLDAVALIAATDVMRYRSASVRAGVADPTHISLAVVAWPKRSTELPPAQRLR